MTTQTHTLIHSYNAWQRSVDLLALKLPIDIHTDNIAALRLLPIFAIVAVIDSSVLSDDLTKNPSHLMQLWADESGWIIQEVVDQKNIKTTATTPKEASDIADVKVFRYLLAPKHKHQMDIGKKDAIAHIVDEQITAYLKRKLTPPPTYNYAVNERGEVANFEFGANKKRSYVDCHILSISQMLRRHKLACFDMDSTLIRQEVIVELAKYAGTGDKIEQLTEAAMRGQMDFATSFAQRMALLKGVDESAIEEIKQGIIPHKGAFTTIAILKALGYRTALISGGFTPFAEHVAKLLGIDEYYANPLHIQDGKITGELIAPILTGNEKGKIVAKIADSMAIDLEEVVCVGDGANDLPMMNLSDLGLAYHAKAIVQVKADAAINITGLEGVLYALGYTALQKE